MIRVSGSNVFFYSHKFSDNLLKSSANGTEPLDHSQIQRFTRIVNDQKRHGLSLLVADDRVIIFRILDCVQQIISNMWTSVLLWSFHLFFLLFCQFLFICWIHWQRQAIFRTSFLNSFVTYFIWNTYQLLIQVTEGHSVAIYFFGELMEHHNLVLDGKHD